jgi:hypothetical protein
VRALRQEYAGFIDDEPAAVAGKAARFNPRAGHIDGAHALHRIEVEGLKAELSGAHV